MSTLFNNPAQIEVLPPADGEVRYLITYKGVATQKAAPAESALAALQTEIARTAKRTGAMMGAVVFNAALPDVAECSFLVTDGSTLWDASPEEVTADQEKHWGEQHRAWKRRLHLGTRRAVKVGAHGAATPVDAPVEHTQHVPAPFVPERGPELPGERVPRVPQLRVRERAPEPAQEQQQPKAKLPVSKMTSLMDDGKHDERATEGVFGGLNMLLGLHLPPGKDELRRREFIRSIQRGWPGVGHITVVNEKGSSSKTPTTSMLAAVLQSYGKGQVVVRDGNPSGNAHERAEYIPPAGRDEHGDVLNDGDLARRHLDTTLPPLTNTQLWDYLHLHTTDRYALLSHHVQHAERDYLTDEESDASYQALAPMARAIITDTGNVPWERRDVPVLHRTQQLVVPMLTYPDRENGARKTLGDTLESRGGHYTDLVRNALVVIHQAEDNRTHARRVREYEARWRDAGVRDIIAVPYDEHMASHRLRLGELRDDTREAFLRLGAGCAEGLRAA